MKSLHLLVKKKYKYQYFILVSLILVAWHRNSISHVIIIQLRLINKCNTDYERYFISVANFKTVCLHPIVAYAYVLSFLTHVLGDMKNLKCFFLLLLYMHYSINWIILIKYLMMILFFVFNATFSNISAISWRPALVVEEAGVPGEIHRPWPSNW